MNYRHHRRRTGGWKVLLFFQIILLLILFLVAFLFFRLDAIPRENINRQALEQVRVAGNFTNIALFGLDAEDGFARSDSIMIASINHRSGEVKVVSVFRDTLMLQADGSYNRANAAYAFGGPELAVRMLNRNLDLDIERFIAVEYKALTDIVDIVGGVLIDVQPDEVELINSHAGAVADELGRENIKIVTGPGPQMLNGLQATGYSRIRMTVGDDFRRAQRQRDVLQQIVSRSRTAGPRAWMQIVDEVIPNVSTNLTSFEMIRFGVNLLRIRMDEMQGWPFEVTTSSNVAGLAGSYVIPINHAGNVRQLHYFLFGNNQFQPSERVQQISGDISWMTGIY